MLATEVIGRTENAIGNGVFGGTISGTLLAIYFVPVYFICVSYLATKLSSGDKKNLIKLT